MKTKLFSLFFALVASVGTIIADGTKIGDLYYNLDAENLTAEVTRSGDYRGLTTVNIPSSVTYNSQTYSVTSIGDDAFYGCSSLTSVTIPNSVTSIGDWAFQSCRSLTSIIVESGNSMYDSRDNCNAIIETSTNTLILGCQNTIIPYSVTSIGQMAFFECSNLTSVTIPNSVTSIGHNAFRSCRSLTSVTIGNSVTSIGEGAFWSCSSLTSVSIPNSVTSIGHNAFRSCRSLTSVTIPNSVTSIGWGAFADCSGLTSIIVESGNSMYDSRDNCNAIIETSTNTLIAGCQNTTIPNSVTSIGDYAFSGCSGLTSITCEAVSAPELESDVFKNVDKSIPLYVPSGSIAAYQAAEGWNEFTNIQAIPVQIGDLYYNLDADNLTAVVTYQEYQSSDNYSGLTSANIPSSVTYSDKTFSVTSIGNYAFQFCTGLTSITIPNSVTSIGWYAFYGCSSLTSIVIPDSVTSIGWYAFYGCSSLTSIVIPDGVPSIGDHAFYNCSDLTSVTIPNSVTSIGDDAFWNCSGLTSITIPNSVTSIGDSAFYGCSSLTSITIPNSVTSIGEYVFYGCPNVTVYIPSTLSCGALGGATIVRYDAIIGDYIFQIGNGSANLMTIDPETLNNTINKCWAWTWTYAGTSVTDYIWSTERECVMMLQQAQKMISTGTYSYKPASANDENSCYQLSDDAQNAQERKEVHNNYQTTVLDTAASWYLFAYIGKEQHLTLPTRVEGKVYGISQRAFQNTNIQSIVLPNGLTSIGDYAFAGCSSLKNTIVPDGVQRVGEYAFKSCSALTEVTCNAEIIGTRAWEGCSSLVKVNILEGCDSIGDYAFTGCGNITTINLPSTLTYIGVFAFDTERIIKVYNYASMPFDMNTTNNYTGWALSLLRGVLASAKLYVPQQSIELYSDAYYWGYFGTILPITATETNVTAVIVNPTDNTATIAWPTVSGADTYEMVIKDRDGNIICTLIFDANGQLMAIAYAAPGRDANQQTQAAGFSFTVTGLESGTSYDLTIVAKDSQGAILETTTQSFTTTGGIMTDVDAIAANQPSIRKLIKDGQLLILRDGKTYTVQGLEVK